MQLTNPAVMEILTNPHLHLPPLRQAHPTSREQGHLPVGLTLLVLEMYLQAEEAGVDVEEGVVVEDVEGHVCQEVSFNSVC